MNTTHKEKDIIVGLDIGTTKIACFIGKRADDGRVKILGFGRTPSKGVEHGVVKNIKSTSESICKAVEDASAQAGIPVKEVYVGIAGQHIKSFSNSGSIMIPHDHKLIEQEDIDRLINEQYGIPLNPGEEIIHIFPQSFIVDGEELSNDNYPEGVAGKQLQANFHIVTGNTMNLMNIHESIERAGLKIRGVVLEPVASSYAVLDARDRDAGVALVDIGGGTTDIGVLTMNGLANSSSIKVAGDTFDDAIVKYVRKKMGVNIGLTTAEEIKISIGCVYDRAEPIETKAKGRDFKTGLAKDFTISSEDLLEALKRPARAITDEILSVLEQTSPELVADIARNGIALTGGAGQIWGMDKLIAEKTGMNCVLADDADSCVAYGCGKSLKWINRLQEGPINIARRRLLKE